MLRDLSDSLARHLLQAFPAIHNYSKTEFTRDPMPPLVSGFLGQMLQSRLDLEVEHLRDLGSDWFDYGHPDIQHAQATFIEMLGRHACIPREEWPRLLKEAVHLVLSYLVRPVPTLLNFIYDDGEGPISPAEVFRGITFFNAYPYFRDVAQAYFQQRNVREIERERLEMILRHSDQQITREYDAVAWLRILTPLYNLAGTDLHNVDRSLPVEVLDEFFGEKDAGAIQLKLREAAEGQERMRLTEQELHRLLESPADQPALSEMVEPEPAKPLTMPRIPAREAPAPVSPKASPAPVAAPSPAAAPAPAPQPAGQPKAVPLWQQFQRPKTPQAQEPMRTPPSAREPVRTAPAPPPPHQQPKPQVARPAPPPEQASTPKAVPLWQQFRKPKQAEQADSGLGALERAVLGDAGSSNRNMFISQLFSGSQADYERVLAILQETPTWKQASRIIAEEVFRKHKVDIYGDSAVLFTNAVQGQFE